MRVHIYIYIPPNSSCPVRHSCCELTAVTTSVIFDNEYKVLVFFFKNINIILVVIKKQLLAGCVYERSNRRRDS